MRAAPEERLPSRPKEGIGVLQPRASRLIRSAGRFILAIVTTWMAFLPAASGESASTNDLYPRLPPRMTLVIIPLDEQPATRGDETLIARLGLEALALPAEKVVRVPRPRGRKELHDLFDPLGPLTGRLEHRDLLFIVFCGGHASADSLRVGPDIVSVAEIATRIEGLVVAPSGQQDAFFRGNIAVAFDQPMNLGSVPDSSLRDSALMAWPDRGDGSAWSRVDVMDTVLATKAYQKVPVAAIGSLFREEEAYRPGAALFALEILGTIFEPSLRKADLSALADGLASRSNSRGSFRKGPGFTPDAFLVVIKTVRVFLETRGLQGQIVPGSPVESAADLLGTYLSLKASALLARGQSVFLVDEGSYAEADITCRMLEHRGQINLTCQHASGMTLAESDFLPEEFERILPDIATHLLKQYIAVRTEEIELVLHGRPLHVVLLVDHSASTAFTDPTMTVDPRLHRFDGIRKMAFLRIARELFHPGRPLAALNRLSVIYFAGSTTTRTYDGADLAGKASWNETVAGLARDFDEGITIASDTDIAAAITAATRLVQPDLERFDCHVMLMTDGVETVQKETRTAIDRIEELRKQGARIHGLGLFPPAGYLEDLKEVLPRTPGFLLTSLRHLVGPDRAYGCYADPACRQRYKTLVLGIAVTNLGWLESIIARSDRSTREGFFVTSSDDSALLAGLERIFATFYGRKVVSSVAAPIRGVQYSGEDVFEFDVEDEGDYEFTISNQDQLSDLSFRAFLEGRDVTSSLDVDASNPTATLVRVKGAVRGHWRILRRGVP